MSRGLEYSPSERLQLVAERLQREGIFHRIKALNLVVVDHCHEVAQLVVAGEKQRLPDRSLIAFAVGHDAEDTMFLSFSAGS